MVPIRNLLMTKLRVPDEPCQATRRIDYLTAVHYSATPAHQREVFDHLVGVGEDLGAELRWEERGASSHFEKVFTHDVGFRIELTGIDGSGTKNPGMTCFTVPGAGFYLQSSQAQMLMLWKVLNGPGFKWLSRIDLQNTELDPDWPVERVYEGLLSRELWVAGYRSYRTWGEVDGSGDCEDGRSVYYGSTRSQRQGRTYDKAKQLGWRTPAIRDEVQLRGDWAHAVGRELSALLKTNLTSAQMDQAVQALVTSSLNQHLQYWDLNGADPKADKNWKRQANPSDWYAERIGRHCDPIQKEPREKLDLERAYRYGMRQYGRHMALRTLVKHKQCGMPVEDLVAGMWEQMFTCLKREDLERVYGADGPEAVAAAVRLWTELRDEHARNEEFEDLR